jgi:hypothetical protein
MEPTPDTANMKNTLLVVTDLGGFKAYRIDNGELHRTPRLELLEEFNNDAAHGRLVDRVTDLGGRFPRSTGNSSSSGAMSDGERHNIQLEQRKRLVRLLAQRLNSLLLRSEIECCFLAASREIHRQLLEELDSRVRAKIERNLSADLTKVGKSDLLGYFQPVPRPAPSGLRLFA